MNRRDCPEPCKTATARSIHDFLALCVILFVTASAYHPVFNANFVYDDRALILENKRLNNSGEFLYSFSRFEQDTGKVKISDSGVGRFRPIPMLVSSVVARIFDRNCTAWHTINCSIFLLTVAGVFYLFRLWCRVPLIYCGATMVFALHPINVEAVALIALFGNTLWGLGCVLFLLSHELYRRGNGAKYLMFQLVALMIAIFSRESALLFPAVALLRDFLMRKKREYVHGISAGRLATTYLIPLTIYLFTRNHALGGINPPFNIEGNTIAVIVLRFPVIMLHYFSRFVFPQGLSPIYDQALAVYSPVTGFILLATLTLLIVRYLAETDEFALTAGFCCFFGLLPVVFGTNLPDDLSVQDRYMFVSAIGASYLFILTLRSAQKRFGYRKATPVLIIGTCIFLWILTLQQAGKWITDIDLFSHCVLHNRQSWRAHHNLGMAFMSAGNNEAASKSLLTSFALSRTAQTAAALGELYYNAGNNAKAREYFKQSLDNWPEASPELLIKAGFSYRKTGDTESSLRYFERLVRDYPDYEATFKTAGLVMLEAGRYEAAREMLSKAYNRYSDDPEIMFFLGEAYLASGDRNGALAWYAKCSKEFPAYLPVRERMKQLENK